MTNHIRLIAASLLLSVFAAGSASAQQDTLQVSSRYTSHVIFASDVTYADMSNPQVIAAKVVEQNKNMIALKARGSFPEPCSISALESNGRMWTFIVVYRDSPDRLIVDTRVQRGQPTQSDQQVSQTGSRPGLAEVKGGRRPERKTGKAANQSRHEGLADHDGGGSIFSSGKSRNRSDRRNGNSSDRDSYGSSYGQAASPGSGNVSTWKRGDAPTLEEVAAMPRKLYHIGTSGYGVDVQVEDIYSYSDITYVVISVENGSGISWDVTDATFVIESRRQTRRTVSYDQTVFPKSRYGTLGAGPGGAGRIVYSFNKLTLSEDQVLKVYLYESSGERNLVMTVSPDDINRAKSLADVRR